jgi:hypothetical protein
MPTKGHKSQAGVGDLYETPKEKLNLTVTETAKANLDKKATKLGISKSELIERFARDTLICHEDKNKVKVEATQELLKKWLIICSPKRRSLARWEHLWTFLQELTDIMQR